MQKSKDDNLLSNMSAVDELLDSLSEDFEATSKEKENSLDTKIWSMNEVDKLLGIENNNDIAPESSYNLNKTDTSVSSENKEIEHVKDDDIQNIENINNSTANKSPSIEDTSEKSEKLSDDKTRVFNSKSEIKKALATFDPEENESSSSNFEKIFSPEPALVNEDTDNSENTNVVDIKNKKDEKKANQIMKLATDEDEKENQKNQKTLTDIRPTYNESIKHNIKTKKIEKVSDGIETNEYREKFLNRPVQNLEKTADYKRLHLNDPQPKVERPGIIVKKGGFSSTADLEPIPTIISAEEELKKEAEELEKSEDKKDENETPKVNCEEITGQIKLSGFDDHEEIEKVDEEDVEDSLKKARKEKIKSFKLSADLNDFSSDLDEKFFEDEENEEEDLETSTSSHFSYDYIDDEYKSPKDKSIILKQLSKAKKSSLVFSFIEAIICITSIVLSIFASSAQKSLEIFGGNDTVILLIHLLLLLFACAFGLRITLKGISGMFSLKPNSATGTFIVFLLCVIQCVVLIFLKPIPLSEAVIYAPIACLSYTISSFARYIVIKRALGNFEFCTGGTSLYSTEKIYDEDDAFEIGRGLLMGEPDIRYSSRIKFPAKFIENSFFTDPADILSAKLVPIVFGISLIIAIISGVLSKNILNAFSSLVAICSIGIPVFSLFTFNLPLLISNKELNSSGCAILGHQSTMDCTSTNAIVIDSYDLFKNGRCGIDGIKTFHNMRIDEAILDTAALVIKSGGPLTDVFDGVILGRREILPEVESLAYEDKLGLSAWIHSRRVLLGSRDLLINHNVVVPDINVETKYIRRGKKVMYLSIAGKVAAMFVISYYANDAIGKALRKIEEKGLTTLVRTCDCNITEDLICKYFNLPLSAIKIISPISGDIYKNYRKTTLAKSSSGILHNGTENSFFNSLIHVANLNKLISINKVVQIIYSAVAVAIFTLLSFLNGISSVGIEQIIIFQLAWTLIATLIPTIKKS